MFVCVCAFSSSSAPPFNISFSIDIHTYEDIHGERGRRREIETGKRKGRNENEK